MTPARLAFDTWVVNSSPLIVLDKINCAPLLSRLARDVVIPEAVLAEVTIGPKALVPSRLGTWRAATVSEIHPIVAAWDLGAGESAVICCAAAIPGAIAIVDDRAARLCAAVLQIPVCGTMGVLLEAKRANLIPAVAPVIRELTRCGLFLSDAVIAKVLRLAGEAP